MLCTCTFRRHVRHAAAGLLQGARRKSMPPTCVAASVGVTLGLSVGVGVGGAVLPTASAAGAAENDMDSYLKVLVALQSRLDSMSTKFETKSPGVSSNEFGLSKEERRQKENERKRHGRVMKDRDELAAKQVLGYTRLKGVTFWKITDLYKDSYYFGYVVDEFAREVRRQGCSWVAAPAPRALPILGAVALKAGLPACYIHKMGELPGETRSVSEGPYKLELPVSLNLKGHKIALIDDGVSSGGSMLACAKLLEQAGGEVVVYMAPVMYQYAAAKSAREAILTPVHQAKVFTLFDLGDKPPPPVEGTLAL